VSDPAQTALVRAYTSDLHKLVAKLARALDNPTNLEPVPADGGVHMRLEAVPVYWARCPDCQMGHGFPSFGCEIGTQRADQWIKDHRRTYCSKRKRRAAAA
jgi:hypothetical protein